MPITGSVGKGGINAPADVQQVEEYLKANAHWLAPMPALVPDGQCAAETIEAIKKFQQTACAFFPDDADGVVSPKGFTISRLEKYVPKPKHAFFSEVATPRAASTLSDALIEAAAKTLGCEVNAIKAVVEQEVKIRGPWAELGRPTILYERHIFWRLTGGIWNKPMHRDISFSSKSSGTTARNRYGYYSAQVKKLYRAATLDESAALKAASYGAFQILGENFAVCGYASVEAFVDGMMVSVENHLDAFVKFVSHNATLKTALKDKDWTTFARIYNGPGFAENEYDTKMGEIYDRLTAPPPGKAGPLKK